MGRWNAKTFRYSSHVETTLRIWLSQIFRMKKRNSRSHSEANRGSWLKLRSLSPKSLTARYATHATWAKCLKTGQKENGQVLFTLASSATMFTVLAAEKTHRRWRNTLATSPRLHATSIGRASTKDRPISRMKKDVARRHWKQSPTYSSFCFLTPSCWSSLAWSLVLTSCSAEVSPAAPR